MYDFMLHLLECSAAMSAIGLLFLAVRAVLVKRYAPKWRCCSWLFIFAGFLVILKPRLSTLFLYQPKVRSTGTSKGTYAAGSTAGVSRELVIIAAVILFVIWLIGSLIILLIKAERHRQFLRITGRIRQQVADLETGHLLEELKEQQGISEKVHIYQVKGISSPMLTGFFSPVILLPEESFRREELKLILKHELIHYKRKDLWRKLLSETVCVIHWFNPLIYWFKHVFEKDLECYCDDLVLAGENREIRKCYCEAIIHIVRGQSSFHTAFSTGFGNGTGAVKRRLEEILSRRKRYAFCWLAIAVAAGAVFSGNALSLDVWGLENGEVYQDLQETSDAFEGQFITFTEDGTYFTEYETYFTEEDWSDDFITAMTDWQV